MLFLNSWIVVAFTATQHAPFESQGKNSVTFLYTLFADFEQIIIIISHFTNFEQVIIKISYSAAFEQFLIKISHFSAFEQVIIKINHSGELGKVIIKISHTINKTPLGEIGCLGISFLTSTAPWLFRPESFHQV